MSYITPDIIEVKALEDYKIYIKFETNEEKIYDMKKNISKIEYYKKLKNIEYFNKVVTRGETIEWPEENMFHQRVYIMKVNLYNFKKQVKPAFCNKNVI